MEPLDLIADSAFSTPNSYTFRFIGTSKEYLSRQRRCMDIEKRASWEAPVYPVETVQSQDPTRARAIPFSRRKKQC